MTKHVNSLNGWNNYLKGNLYTLGRKTMIIIITTTIIIIEWYSKKKNNVWFYVQKRWFSIISLVYNHAILIESGENFEQIFMMVLYGSLWWISLKIMMV
jgi:hypothetical protein